MFSNAQENYNIASSGNYHFDASGFRKQGSVLDRAGQGFMFTNYLGYGTSSSGFNLNDTPSPFQYTVKPSSVASIFNNIRYGFYRSVGGLGSVIYTPPTAPERPTPSVSGSGSGEGGIGSGNR